MKEVTAKLLKERQASHGDYPSQAEVAQAIKTAIFNSPNYCAAKLRDQHTEALDMIASKIARICTGDPDFADHWKDIQGYAALGGGLWTAGK